MFFKEWVAKIEPALIWDSDLLPNLILIKDEYS